MTTYKLDIGEPTEGTGKLRGEELAAALKGADTSALDAVADAEIDRYLRAWERAVRERMRELGQIDTKNAQEEIKHVFGKCVDTDAHKTVPCPQSGADSGGHKPPDRAAQFAHLEADVEAMEATPEGKETLSRGAKLAEKVKTAIGTAAASALQALDDESGGGGSYLLASIRKLDAGGVNHGLNAVARGIFTNVHEEIFELALAQHSLPGAHAIGAVGAKIAAVAETGLLKAVAWAWRKAMTREALEWLTEAGAELTDADKRFVGSLARIAALAIRVVLKSAGVEDAEIDRAALGRRILARLQAAA